MNKEMEHLQDDKTVLLDRLGHGPAQGNLTDGAAPPRFEQLEERMIYAARQPLQSTFSGSLNALVAAASDLLSEVVQLKQNATGEDLPSLNRRLSSALALFIDSAIRKGVENNQASTARYVLCTVIDEAVVTTAWGRESEWSQMSLLSKFHNETFGGERFFQLLDRLSKNPIKHLPMLELMYLCLALGFEGKYRIQTRGLTELDNLRDALYRQIRQIRTDVPRELSPHWQGNDLDQRRGLVRIVPWWKVVVMTLICMTAMFSGFAWVLGEQRASVLQPFQVFEQTVAPPLSQMLKERG
jgi:type VI secretion system protein ImpK